jgi:uncharacterized membrane protein YeaQ/YmgE (transglycosylase-associated protein family)
LSDERSSNRRIMGTSKNLLEGRVGWAPATALWIAFLNLNLMFGPLGGVFFIATNGSLLSTVCAGIASGVSMTVLATHRGYRTAIVLNAVATLVGAVHLAVLVTDFGRHPPGADILAVLSAAVCGATIPLNLLRSERRT